MIKTIFCLAEKKIYLKFVSEEFILSWLEKICSQPRAASLLNKNHPLLNQMFSHFNRYLQESLKQSVKVQTK